MTDSTPGKSRSGKNRKNRSSDTPDLAVEVAVHGKFTISARRLAKKLKWPTVVAGFLACLLFMPRIDVEFTPPPVDPVAAHSVQT